MRFFTHYWKNATWDDHFGRTLRSTAGNQFKARGVSAGDFVYVVTVRNGRLFVGCRLMVKTVVGRKAAEQALGRRDLWPADDYVMAERSEPFSRDTEVPARLAAQLRFMPGRALAFKHGQLLDQQTLRGVRELTPESAAILDGVLGGSAASQKAAVMKRDRAWRADPVAAGQVLQRLLQDTSAETRDGALRILGETILTAQQRHSNRWVVTRHEPYVRLIVGMVMCLQLRADGRATVVLSRSLAPRCWSAGA